MVHPSACVLLLLLLTCLAGFSASETEQGGTMVDISYGPSAVGISGVGIVTVGIPYFFQCTAKCYPGCKFTWTRGNVTSQGPELTLQLLHVAPTQTLTCTVVNPTTGKSASVQKTLLVAAGPSNIQISGPPMLTFGFVSEFTCSANCYPSCSYSWSVILNGQEYKTAQGNTISVSPPRETVSHETLICKAEDTVSHLFISTTLKLWVATLSDIRIAGESTVTMGKQYRFLCLATCIPSCSFTWKYMGKTFVGDQIQIPILHQGDIRKFSSQLEITVNDYLKIEPLTCEATNTVSQAKITTTKNLTVIDPISVRPASKAQPVAGEPFSLQCVGSQNPASITWLKNKHPVPASERVQFSPDNTTMSFSPLQQTDDGLYQCVVAEGEIPIQSVGYKMQVNYGPSSVVISGVDIVTVGNLYVFHCSASCYPTCQFTWTCGNVTSQGPELSLQFAEPHLTQNLTCTAVNPATGVSVSAQKTLPMTAGPSNMQISGPAFLTAGVASNFTCSADCYPSCSYAWTVVLEDELSSTAQGHTISVTPPSSAVISETLVCKAEDTVSHLSLSSSLHLWVASLSDITITGDSTVSMGKQYKFSCSATCIPSCSFTWKYMGKTFVGDQIQIPILRQEDILKLTSRLEITVSDYSKIEPLTCEATNTVSHATVTTTKNLTVTDPFSVQPSSQALPVAGQSFSLQCVGSQSPASITWLKDKLPMLASERVQFSPDNTTMSFSPLLRADGGLYQCLVLEAGNHNHNTLVVESRTPILSVGYLMNVNYGPGEVLIAQPNKGPVGEELVVLPGSTTELQCLTDCLPVCSIAWFYHGTLVSTNASMLLTPETPPYKAALACVAFNSVTKRNRTAETVVAVPDGPKHVVISGPDSLEIGVPASFTCSAECSPSCSFTWTVYGNNVTGSGIDILVNQHITEESISCWAENTFTGKTAMISERLSVSDPHWCGC
ncbi:cell adhesion molecule CEACAM5-like [Trachinotus anak]|uniref:cell adhesion molecule CEACAM5-like n=1 Tax=Trachinotus anak TaxID=443729 RepID=UPI0039F1F73B